MDDHSLDETKQTGSDGFLKKLYRPGPLVALFVLAFALLVGVGYYVLNQTPPSAEVITEPSAPQPAPLVYEEEGETMEDMVKQADLAIIETIRDLQLEMRQLDLVDVSIKRADEQSYHYQVLQLPRVKNKNSFIAALKYRLNKRLPDATLADNGTDEASVVINGQPTHRLLLELVPLTLPRPEVQGPRLAIVIDDIGEGMQVLKGLLNLDFPVTLAVWPNASQTRESVELIAQRQREILIHFPMEPRGYPRYNPGDDALFITMSPEEIRARVTENVSRIPEAIGVNNHMGSRFTADKAGMDAALDQFKMHGLFFLDSLTTGASVGRNTAKTRGISFYERDIFIDNVKDIGAIVHQLKKAENVALKTGTAVAIGHPYKETLAALERWSKLRNKEIRLVSLSAIPPE